MGQYLTAKAYYGLASTILDFRFKIENEEILRKHKSAVLVVNHQSELDILAIGRTFGPNYSVIAKKSLRYVPILGWFMILSDVVFIDRSRRSDAIQLFAKAARRMRKENISIWVFAEGTRSYSLKPCLLPLKKGAFHLAVQAQVPIIPIAIQTYGHLFHPPTKVFNKGEALIKVLDPIPTEGKTAEDVNDLLHETETAMNNALVEIDDYGKVKKQ
ncbi:1-acyl-sn-glycerol-3-phosphate acyltransferase [Schizosaccharomyces pombe]